MISTGTSEGISEIFDTDVVEYRVQGIGVMKQVMVVVGDEDYVKE